MNDKINILFLVPKFDIGGVQKVCIRMINCINRDRFNVHVLYVKEGVLKNEVNEDGIFITKLGDTLKLKSLIIFKYINKVVKYIKQNNIDVIHSIDPVLYAVGATASYFTKIIHIRTQPNFIRRHEKLNTKTLKILPIERWTDKFITLNDASNKDLQLAGVSADKIVTIYSYSSLEEYVNFNDLTDMKKEFNIPYDSKIILAMHRMVPKKGYETFIEMIPYIIKEYKNVVFLLVGDGPLRSFLEKRVCDLGIEEYVRFTGFRLDIMNIFKQIDFGVYPLADTAAMVGVIKSGKVLITKKNSSMDEYIIHGVTGYLVPEHKPEIYAKYSLKLLKDTNLLKKMEENQREFLKARYSGNNNMEKFENIAINLCRRKKN